MPADLHKAREIFLHAVGKLPPEEWDGYVAETCGVDAELLWQVGRLLQVHREAGSFLDRPAAAVGSTGDFAPGREEMAAAVLRERPGTVIGPYKLLQQIGEGGMGTVFMAEQTQPVQRKVALKVIKAGMDSAQIVARFEAERQALAMMDHVNIARVFDAGATESGRPYFVMELVHGVPITKYCDDHQLTPRQRLELFVPVCQAIQHAHQKGIIHRDVKPSNVMVTLYDGKPVPKVIDFGVAKATEQKLTERTLFTQYGAMVGTLEYMSPEQAEMSALGVDTRSDIYSLGVLLYELLTGSTPLTRKRFKDAAYGEILRIIKEEEPPKPSTRLSDSGAALQSISAQRKTEPAKLSKLMRGELDWIVMKTLEKDRNRRYETANAFAADIQRYLTDETVQACPPSSWYRFRKFARRNKPGLTMAAVVATAMVLALVVLTISNVWVTSERDQKAEALRDKERALQKEITAQEEAKEQEQLANKNAGEAERLQGIAKGEAARAKEQESLARRRFYASQINLAQQAWDQGQPARVLELLEGQRPKFDQTDLRTFEWYYLWRRCHVDCRLDLHSRNTQDLSIAALAPDGKTLAAPCGGGDIKLWDVASGLEGFTLKGHKRMIWSLAFAPDGKTLASGDFSPGNLILWDIFTGKAKKILDPGQGILRCLAFAADGKTLASGGDDGTVKLWNVATWQEEITLHGHSGPVLCVTFSPDGKTLASGSSWGTTENGLVNLWDMSVKPVKSRLQLRGANTLAFAPDGKTLAGAYDNVRLWDVATGQEKAVHATNGGKIDSVAFSPDGKTLAFGNADRTVKVWEIGSDREYSYPHHNKVEWVAFSPDGKTVASASGVDCAVKLWNVPPAQEPATLRQKGEVVSVAFSPDGTVLASGGSDSTKLWDVAASRETATLQPGNAVFSHDGKTLAIANWNPFLGQARNTVTLIAVANRQEQAALEGSAANHIKAVGSLAFSPDDKTLAIAGYGGVPQWWDLATRKVRSTLDGNSVAFSPDGKTFATGTGVAAVSNGAVTLWDAHTGQERLMCQAGRTTWVFCVQFSPDGALVAQTTDYGTILLWDVATGALHASLKGHTSSVNCVAFHPDGKTLASASTDKTVKLWDVATGQERITLVGHDGPVQSVAFAPDGNTLASGSTDGTVKLWRAATDREAVAPRTEREPDEPDSFFAMINQGDMLHRSGQSEAAEQIYHKAASRLEKLTAAFPKEPEYRRDMALTDYTLGSMFKTNGRIPEAEEAYHRVRIVMEKLTADFPKEALSRGDLLHSQWYRIDLSQAAGRRPEAEYRAYGANVYRNLAIDLAKRGKHSEAMDAYREAINLKPDDPLAQNNLAWLLATCPEPRFRDPVKAVALAKKAVELTPKQGIFWNTLGTAYYRAGDWKVAIEALNMSMDLRNGGDAFDWFFLAMAHWQQGDKMEAGQWYNRAVAWMDENAAQNEELRRFRGEASELLGIGKTKE